MDDPNDIIQSPPHPLPQHQPPSQQLWLSDERGPALSRMMVNKPQRSGELHPSPSFAKPPASRMVVDTQDVFGSPPSLVSPPFRRSLRLSQQKLIVDKRLSQQDVRWPQPSDVMGPPPSFTAINPRFPQQDVQRPQPSDEHGPPPSFMAINPRLPQQDVRRPQSYTSGPPPSFMAINPRFPQQDVQRPQPSDEHGPPPSFMAINPRFPQQDVQRPQPSDEHGPPPSFMAINPRLPQQDVRRPQLSDEQGPPLSVSLVGKQLTLCPPPSNELAPSPSIQVAPLSQQKPIAKPIAPQPPPPPPPPFKYPIQDLLGDDRRTDFIEICVPLYNALMTEDWEDAQSILSGRPYLLRSSITENYETPLHVAASAQSNTKSINFVQNLVNMMDPEDLLLQNRYGNTALSLAAASGSVNIARIMVIRNSDLPTIPNAAEMMPLYIAIIYKNQDMVDFLYEKSQKMGGRGWTPINRGWVFLASVEVDYFDFALKVLDVHSELAQNMHALATLARNPSVFKEIEPNYFMRIVNSIFCSKVESIVAMESKAMQLLRKMWTNIQKKPKDEIDRILRGPMVMKDGNETYPSRILFVAAEMGNSKFVAELIRRYPDLIWKKNENNQSIFHVAISHLQENIYNLLYEIGSMKALIIPLIDRSDYNNMLHLVGKKPEDQLQGVSGVAFRMQRKLLWFKEVESMIPPHHKEQKNNSGLTPYQLFTENHKALVSESEKWMKGTASQCIVVAALIATVVFAVAYTIPGGYQQTDNKKNGYPVFLHNGPFLAFVILDAISLILSSTSILVFLSILTSRYAQEDFLESLPRYLMVGLLMLFFSVVTMMISFSISFFVIYRGNFIAIAIFISVGALIPIVAYAKLQYPLLKDVFRSTYGSRYLFKPKKRMLYYQHPKI